MIVGSAWESSVFRLENGPANCRTSAVVQRDTGRLEYETSSSDVGFGARQLLSKTDGDIDAKVRFNQGGMAPPAIDINWIILEYGV